MKILNTSLVKEADAYTIENEPINGFDLMERAATRASDWILKNFDDELFPLNVKIIVGPGNNGGDGLVIARKLWEKAKYFASIEVFVIEFTKKYSPDFQINLKRLKSATNIPVHIITDAAQLPGFDHNDLIIEGIFGSGLNRPVKGFPAQVIEKINNSPKFAVIAIDVPSGLFGDRPQNPGEIAIEADFTLTFEFPFFSFFLQENEKHVGDFVVIPIGILPEFVAKQETDYFLIEPSEIELKHRQKFSHKGTFGHGLLVSGGFGRSGAAVLAAKAALRSGLGLLTVATARKNVNVIQTAVPEALTFISNDDNNIVNLPGDLQKFTAVAAGPALGFEPETQELIKQLLTAKIPLILDADAITILSQHKDWYELLPPNTILTPHPKEFERLAGKSSSHYERLQKQREFSQKYNVIVVLKGAYTSVSTPGGKIYFNATGNPGVATGGSGDVLTGIILGLLTQGYDPFQAAITGVYLHGLAADLSLEKHTYETLLPSDVTEKLPEAFRSLYLNENPKFLFTDFSEV